jgi:hypothetical protein
VDVMVSAIYGLIAASKEFREPRGRGVVDQSSPVTNSFALETAFSKATESAQNTVAFRARL